jgi:hypothetical protein
MSIRKLALVVLAAVCVWGVGVVSAGAAVSYRTFEDACGSSQLCVGGASPMAYPFGVAVDESSGLTAGDVYVASLGLGGPSTVSRFTAGGEPAPFPASSSNPQISGVERNQLSFGRPTVGVVGVAVESATGDVYVVERATHSVEKFTPGGERLGSFAQPPGAVGVALAIDNSTNPLDADRGDIYMTDEAHEAVDRFSPAGVLEGEIKGAGEHALVEPTGLAVDLLGSVYVANNGSDDVERFSDTGVYEMTLDDGQKTQAVAIDSSTGDVLLASDGPGGCYVQPYSEGGSQLAGEAFGEGYEEDGYCRGLAASASTHNVYAVAFAHGHGVFFKAPVEAVEPPREVISDPASEVHSTTAELSGALNPGGLARYYFEYGTAECTVVPVPRCGAKTSEAGPLAGNTQQPVSLEELTGLKQGTTYYYWIVATNSKGAAHGEQQTFTTGTPEVGATSFSSVGAKSATLTAQIQPDGSSVTYYVEYGPTSAYGSHTPKQSLLATEGPVDVTARLEENLTPGTSYHFRFVAENEDGTYNGPDETFKTLVPGIQGLPDGRVYEMVSPPENQNADVYRHNGPSGGSPRNSAEDVHTATGLFQAASDGDAVAYIGDATSGEGAGEGRSGQGSGDQYLATRGPEGGWTQTNIQPAGYIVFDYEGFSNDLSTAILLASGETSTPNVLLPPLSAEGLGEGYRDIYLRSTSDGSYHALINTKPSYRAPGEEEFTHDFHPIYAGQSSNGQSTLFEANDALFEGEGALAKEVRNEAMKEVEEDNKNPGDYKDHMLLYDSTGGRLSLVDVLPDGEAEGNATFGAPERPSGPYPPEEGPDLSNVISEDGSRVFWTGLKTHDVFLREDRTTTVPVSVGAAQYWTATPDGRYAFYTEGEELWRFDAVGGEGGVGTRTALAGTGAGVLGVIGASNDGEYIYFTATGSLATGASAGGANLYLWHAGTTTFIATLASSDGTAVQPFNAICIVAVRCSGVGDWSASLRFRTAGVAADGHGVAFMSNQSLPAEGYPHGYSNEGLQEVYVYEAEGGGHLFCVSCSPSGEQPPVDEEEAAAWLPVDWKDSYAQHWLSEDGGRVVFESAEPLVASDTNGKIDVYEWESHGTGSCTENAGCVYILSSGSSQSGSWLAGESSSGNDVFIITRSQLTPQDPNSAYNLFDARVGGVQPVTPPQCQGTGCQGLPSAPPIFATPPSQTFNGVGNFPLVSKAPVLSAKPKKKVKAKKKVKTKRKKQKRQRKKKKNGKRHQGELAMRSTLAKRAGKVGVGRGK